MNAVARKLRLRMARITHEEQSAKALAQQPRPEVSVLAFHRKPGYRAREVQRERLGGSKGVAGRLEGSRWEPEADLTWSMEPKKRVLENERLGT